jgi:uncharacterized membrane protein YqaE (UPF0057 family)
MGEKDSALSDFIRAIIAFFIPPLGVAFQVGLRTPFWINLILTLLGYIPGIIHAMYVILHYDVERLDNK